MKTHGGAGRRGDNDGYGFFEYVQGMTNHLSAGDPVSAVKGRLATAGLIFGEFHLASRHFQHLDGIPGDLCVKGIAEASCHKLNPAAGSSLC